MAYTLSNLLQDVLGTQLGRARSFVATGGSATTAADSKLGDLIEPPVMDYAVGYSIFVTRDAGGAGASPENRFSVVTGYNSGTYTYTFDTITDAVAADDEIMLADDLFPLRDLIRIANRVVQKMEVVLEDSSLTTGANQTEYSLPVAYKQDRPLSVFYQGKTGDSDDNRRIPVIPVKYIPAAAGVAATLVLPQLPAGRTLYITGVTAHPALTTYSSVIREEVHPDLLIAGVTYQALVEFNAKNEGKSEYWMTKLEQATQYYNDMQLAHPISAPKRVRNIIPMWGYEEDPGIPDPIYTG